MSGSTTELGMSTAVDGDDNADYLTIGLKNGLQTLDALFNNVTGHNHGSAHQGGPITTIPASAIPDGSITSAKIADGTITSLDLANGSVTSAKLVSPIDLAGWIRSTADNTGAFATTGAGLELYYDATQGVVQVYDRGGSTFKPLILNASQITLIANSHNMVLDSGGTLTTPIGITVNSARGANQGGLNLHAAAAGNDVGVFAENGNLYCWFNNTGGQLLLQGPSGAGWVGATLGSVSVQGQLSTTGNLLAGGAMYVGSAGDTYLTRNGANSLSTSGALLVSGALVVSGAATFQSTLSVSGSLSIANLAVTSYLTAGGGTMPNSGAIRLTANSQIMWSGGSDYGVWIDSSGYFNLKQGQVIAGGASGGSVGTPSTCRGFLQVNISGTGTCKIPIYNN